MRRLAADPPLPSSVLITATTEGPISRYQWPKDVADGLTGSHLMTADIDGLGAFDNSPCAAAAVDRYLADGHHTTHPLRLTLSTPDTMSTLTNATNRRRFRFSR
jgi:hypothetical protein